MVDGILLTGARQVIMVKCVSLKKIGYIIMIARKGKRGLIWRIEEKRIQIKMKMIGEEKTIEQIKDTPMTTIVAIILTENEEDIVSVDDTVKIHRERIVGRPIEFHLIPGGSTIAVEILLVKIV